jgi:DNA-binding transcriptional MerR regulator
VVRGDHSFMNYSFSNGLRLQQHFVAMAQASRENVHDNNTSVACMRAEQSWLVRTVDSKYCQKYSAGMGNVVLRERGRKYVGLPEFARAGEQVLAELGLEQARGTVTSVPDERTIRYYMAEGLVQTPEEKQGTASVFGYLNLLQLLTVKKLQAEHLPIRKIRELVAGKSEQELETLLGIGSTAPKKSRETDAKRYLESLLASAPTPEAAPPRQAAPPPQSDQSQSWQRVEIEPGLELHIRSDYAPPTSARTKSLLEKAIHRLRRYADRRR